MICPFFFVVVYLVSVIHFSPVESGKSGGGGETLGGYEPDGSGGPEGGIFVNQLLKMEDGFFGTDFGDRKFRYLCTGRENFGDLNELTKNFSGN